jgi:hypothetical protein
MPDFSELLFGAGRPFLNGFADLPERDQKYVISGAFFLVSLGILLAIFCFRGNPKE